MPLMNEYTKDTIKESILNKLLRYYGCTIEEATPKQIYAAVASTVRDQIMLKWRFEKEARRNEKAKRLYTCPSSSSPAAGCTATCSTSAPPRNTKKRSRSWG